MFLQDYDPALYDWMRELNRPIIIQEIFARLNITNEWYKSIQYDLLQDYDDLEEFTDDFGNIFFKAVSAGGQEGAAK
jgi:hypothetical protein